MSKSQIMFDLFKKYGLVYDEANPESKDNDVYRHKHYTIITRQGIQKIEQAAGIECEFTPISAACGKDYFTVQVRGNKKNDDKSRTFYTTFASASDLTSTNKYYPEMAEKRGRSRVVLTLAGLYELGVYGQDEADEFSEKSKGEGWQKATYKGGAA